MSAIVPVLINGIAWAELTRDVIAKMPQQESGHLANALNAGIARASLRAIPRASVAPVFETLDLLRQRAEGSLVEEPEPKPSPPAKKPKSRPKRRATSRS